MDHGLELETAEYEGEGVPSKAVHPSKEKPGKSASPREESIG